MFEGVATQFRLPTVEVPATARTPEAVLRHLVARLAADGLIDAGAVGATVRQLLKREEIASTGLARGIALPHCMTSAVSVPTGAVGQVPHGVAWGGVDREPVTAVCLLLCSGETLTTYMRMLEAAFREVAVGLAGREGGGGRSGMNEQEWLTCTNALPMLKFLLGGAKPSERKLRLFGCACCRRAWHNLDAHRRGAVEAGERLADGGAGRWERLWYQATIWPGSGWWEGGTGRTAPKNGPSNMAAYLMVRRWPHHEPDLLECLSCTLIATLSIGCTAADQCYLLQEIVGNPFRPVTVNPAWLAWNDGTVPKLAQAVYDERAFDRLPILADALEEAGCTDAELLGHLRSAGPHARGCWALDSILGKT